MRDTKASVTFGETSGKAEPSRAEISSVVRRNNPQTHKVSRAVTRRGVAGPCRGRGEGLAGPVGGLQGGASARGAVPAPGGELREPGGAAPGRRGGSRARRGGPRTRVGGSRAGGAVPGPGRRSVSPEGSFQCPEGRSVCPEGRSVRLDGRPPLPEGRFQRPEGRSPHPGGAVPALEGRSPRPEGRFQCPEGRSVCPEGRSVCPEGRSVRLDWWRPRLEGRGAALQRVPGGLADVCAPPPTHGMSLVPLPADLKESRGDSTGISGSPPLGEQTVITLRREGGKESRAGGVIIVPFLEVWIKESSAEST